MVKGSCSEMLWPLLLRLSCGATTQTSSLRLAAARSSAASPGEKCPSSLLTRIRMA
jgi:hypothetical protein